MARRASHIFAGLCETMNRPGTRESSPARTATCCGGPERRQMQSDAARARGRRKAHERLPPEMRQQLLVAIYAGQPFRRVLCDLGLSPNQVWGLTKIDDEWSAALDAPGARLWRVSKA
jgi:hypothetical protein